MISSRKLFFLWKNMFVGSKYPITSLLEFRNQISANPVLAKQWLKPVNIFQPMCPSVHPELCSFSWYQPICVVWEPAIFKPPKYFLGHPGYYLCTFIIFKKTFLDQSIHQKNENWRTDQSIQQTIHLIRNIETTHILSLIPRLQRLGEWVERIPSPDVEALELAYPSLWITSTPPPYRPASDDDEDDDEAEDVTATSNTPALT